MINCSSDSRMDFSETVTFGASDGPSLDTVMVVVIVSPATVSGISVMLTERFETLIMVVDWLQMLLVWLVSAVLLST
ncbi:hypothetical protein DSECCO2_155570 [anaerobic digester metagenome]